MNKSNFERVLEPIKFEGKSQLLARLYEEQEIQAQALAQTQAVQTTGVHLFKRINRWLNYEVELPVGQWALGAILICTIMGPFSASTRSALALKLYPYAYQITIVDGQGGSRVFE